MGFEYKIIGKFTENQLKEIVYILEKHPNFDKKYEFNGEEVWELRQGDNLGPMPNLLITFENDGIYVCQYSSSYLWSDLDKLKQYIETEMVEYRILDYSD